jgi:hypothetical protein
MFIKSYTGVQFPLQNNFAISIAALFCHQIVYFYIQFSSFNLYILANVFWG